MKKIREFTCIICPNGCTISAELDEQGTITRMEGFTCPRGAEYVRQELTDPRRTIATSVLITGGDLPLASVRLTKPIPKNRIFDVMTAINHCHLTAPVHIGEVVLHDVLGLDSDVIITKNVDAAS